jgi:DNA-binding NarL/FixJ family response regulator
LTYHIFLVEDHAIMRRSLVNLLQREPDLTVSGQAASVAEALERIPQSEPDLILVDVSLPGRNGLSLVEELGQERPELLCLILSGHNEAIYAKAALQAGARGYVMKGDPAAVLEAIRTVLRGEVYVSEAMRGKWGGDSG